MHRLIASTAALSLALTAMLTSASPARAQCEPTHGTVPGSDPTVTAVGTHPYVVYVDDRGLVDFDDDDDGGGLWIYLESNGREGLQRGGEQVAFTVLSVAGLREPPDPGPTRVGPFTLFPNGARPTFAEMLGFYDHCGDHRVFPDTLLF